MKIIWQKPKNGVSHGTTVPGRRDLTYRIRRVGVHDLTQFWLSGPDQLRCRLRTQRDARALAQAHCALILGAE